MRQKLSKKILVTGGAGFIGSNFIHYILEKYPDYEIINLDKLTYAGNLKNLTSCQDSPNYRFIKGDICDRNLVERLMKEIDWVVNFAAESHVDRSIEKAEDFIKTNLIGTYVLLEAALNNRVKHFHHISTDEVFGELDFDSQKKFNEQTAYGPNSPYSASKAGSDHLVRAYFRTYGLPITISNCSNNYGPYQHPEKVIPRFIIRALKNQPLPIYGKGHCVRDYLYVEDHCHAIDLILHKGRQGETYCVGGGTQVNGAELADEILKIMNKPLGLRQFVKDRPGHDQKYAIDYGKIKKELGWKPQHSFRSGLSKTIRWYMRNSGWWKDLYLESENFYCR